MSQAPAKQVSVDTSRRAYQRLNAWLAHRRRSVVMLIVSAGLVLRVFAYLELAASPCFWMHEWDQTDMHTFHVWALAIVDGDYWSKHVPPPMHSWHRDIAADYAQLFPERWKALSAEVHSDDPDALARALWERWCGGGRTYQGPLYPYLIALTYALLGPAVGWVFAWQMLIGLASLVLIHTLTRRYFDEVAALAATALALLYGPLMHYEFALLRVTLIIFCGLLIVWQIDRARERGTIGSWLGTGVLLGLAVTLKAHFLLMIPAAGLLLAAACRREHKALFWRTVALIGGLGLGLSPLVARNVAAGAPAWSLAANGPPTFLIANARGASPAGWNTQYAARILEETDSAFLPTVVTTLKTQASIGEYLGLISQKVLATWYWYEEPNNTNYYYARLHSGVLRDLPVSFGVIGPLALLGIALGLRRRRWASLAALVATNLVVLLVFFVFARFRLPLAMALLPLAGLTVARFVKALLETRWPAAVGLASAAAIPMIYTLSPMVEGIPLVAYSHAAAGFSVYYDVRLEAALGAGNLSAADDVLREALERAPRAVRLIGPRRPALSDEESRLAEFYGRVYLTRAQILTEAGRAGEAAQQRLRGEQLLSQSRSETGNESYPRTPIPDR